MTAGTTFSEGLFELMDSYDGFIMDQWGVLHNGVEVYPGVLAALNHLKNLKKQVIILSNSGKRSEYNKKRMAELGFKKTQYKEIVSAGEVTWQGLKNQDEGIFENIGQKCFLISRGGETSLLEGLDLEVVSNIEDADFILITGTTSRDTPIEDYEADLKKAVVKGLPAICANPDMITLYGNERAMGPGTIAKRYQEFGGVAHFIGKPHKPVFRYCLSLFDDIMPARVLVIGDSLYHDVAGGRSVDLDTAFITGGIHANAFKEDMSLEQRQKNMEQLAQNYGVRPTWVMDQLIWQTPAAALREKERARMRE